MKAYITKIEYVLPALIVENPKDRLTKKTGIERLHISSRTETAADLAYAAAEKLLANIDRTQIDYLLLCTQSPDYILPTTACILQDKLGLPKGCAALDFNLGCSGYIYGLSLAKGLIESGQARRLLLLTAETYSKYINKQDNTTLPLFGDAATASLIEAIDIDKDGIYGFDLGTDGAGYDKLIVPVGGSRYRYEDTTIESTIDEYGNSRTNANLYMNGSAITEFALEVVPKTLTNILQKANLTKDDIDYYVFHQANKFILKFLRMKCGLDDYPFWNDVKAYGNTVSNTISIALKDLLQGGEKPDLSRVLCIGFGVGLSWGGCIIDLSYYRE